MEAGQATAGGLSDVGGTTGRTREIGQVRGRRMALVGGAVIAAFGGAFAVGAATGTKEVAPARLAPAVGSAQPAALKLAVKPSVSVPTLVPVPKPKAKPKPAKVANAPATAAVAAPAQTRTAPAAVTHTGGVQSAPVPAPASPPVTAPATHPTSTGSTTGTKKTSPSSGSGTVSGSG